MKIDIKGTQLELTPSIKNYIEEKLGGLDRYLGSLETKSEPVCFVEVGRATKHHKQGKVFYAEATLALQGETIRVEHYDDDIRQAVDAVKDRMKTSLQKYKETKTERRALKER